MSAFAIRLENIGKRYNQDWIFRNINIEISKGDKIAILGHNGSGKSTLLQIISGFVTPSKGTIEFHLEGNKINITEIHQHLSFASPYIDLIDDFTLTEMFELYASLKRMRNNLNIKDFISISRLEKNEDKTIGHFSSGMKQRLKLTLAILSDVDFIFLDEPLSNLDSEGILWYTKMTELYIADKTVLICSNNVKDETFFCNRQLSILDYKK